MVKADLSPVWVSEGDDVTEVLVVEIRRGEENTYREWIRPPERGQH